MAITGSISVLGFGLAVGGVGVGAGLVFMALVDDVARQARDALQSVAFLVVRRNRGAGEAGARARVRGTRVRWEE